MTRMTIVDGISWSSLSPCPLWRPQCIWTSPLHCWCSAEIRSLQFSFSCHFSWMVTNCSFCQQILISITSSLMLLMLNICCQEQNKKWNENKKLAPATSSRWDWAPLRSQSPPTQRSLQTLQVLKMLDIFWVCPLPEMRVLSMIVFSSLQYRYIPVGGKITFSTRPLITWIGSGEQDGISAVVNGGCFF